MKKEKIIVERIEPFIYSAVYQGHEFEVQGSRGSDRWYLLYNDGIDVVQVGTFKSKSYALHAIHAYVALLPRSVNYIDPYLIRFKDKPVTKELHLKQWVIRCTQSEFDQWSNDAIEAQLTKSQWTRARLSE